MTNFAATAPTNAYENTNSVSQGNMSAATFVSKNAATSTQKLETVSIKVRPTSGMVFPRNT